MGHSTSFLIVLHISTQPQMRARFPQVVRMRLSVSSSMLLVYPETENSSLVRLEMVVSVSIT